MLENYDDGFMKKHSVAAAYVEMMLKRIEHKKMPARIDDRTADRPDFNE